MLAKQLQNLFAQYHQAFKAQNIGKTIACYHFPCTLITPDRLVLLSNIKQAEQEFTQIFAGINRVNITSFKALEASYESINENIIAVNVHWQFFDKNNEIIADFYALYHILKNEQQFKIFQVISHEVESSINLSFPLNLTETVE